MQEQIPLSSLICHTDSTKNTNGMNKLNYYIQWILLVFQNNTIKLQIFLMGSVTNQKLLKSKKEKKNEMKGSSTRGVKMSRHNFLLNGMLRHEIWK